MKAVEFNKTEPTWLKIEEQTIKVCKDNNVDYYSYLGRFVRYGLLNYIKSKALIKTVEALSFSDPISTRAILNKKHISSKEKELDKAVDSFLVKRKELFDWLDKTKEPYFFVMNPVYEYGAGFDYNSWFTKKIGYIKVAHTGSQNLHIALDYAQYKLSDNKN